MSYQTWPVLRIAVALSFVVAGCSAITALNEAEQGPGVGVSPTPLIEPEETFLHTDPPLPTFHKSPLTTPDNAAWAMPDCVDWEWQVDAVTDPEALAEIVPLIAVVKFVGYRDARWNTPDGERPSSEEYHDATYDLTIVRDVEFVPDLIVRGSADELSPAYVRGGTVGCDSIRYSDFSELTPGMTYVFFMEPRQFGGTTNEVRTHVLRAWPVSADGSVTTDAGAMLLSDLVNLIESIPYSPSDVLRTPGVPLPTGGSPSGA